MRRRAPYHLAIKTELDIVPGGYDIELYQKYIL